MIVEILAATMTVTTAVVNALIWTGHTGGRRRPPKLVPLPKGDRRRRNPRVWVRRWWQNRTVVRWCWHPMTRALPDRLIGLTIGGEISVDDEGNVTDTSGLNPEYQYERQPTVCLICGANVDGYPRGGPIDGNARPHPKALPLRQRLFARTPDWALPIHARRGSVLDA